MWPLQSPKLGAPGVPLCGLGALFCYSRALIAVGFTGRDMPSGWPAATILEELLCRSWPYRAGLASVGLWCSPSPPLGCVICGGGRVVIQHGLKLSTGCSGSGASQEMQSQPPPMPCLGPPGMSYRKICRWFLFVLGLKVPGRDQTVKQGRLVPGLGPLSQRLCRDKMPLVWEILGKFEAWDKRSH